MGDRTVHCPAPRKRVVRPRGLTTKLHALVDAQGLPVRVLISEGQAWDGRYARQLSEHLRPGTVLLADRAYDSAHYAARPPRKAHAPTFHRCRGGWRNCRSARGFIASAIRSSGSSQRSSITAPSQHDMKAHRELSRCRQDRLCQNPA
ncbi:MAG: transposase [Hyphomicrobiaceae bacterium]